MTVMCNVGKPLLFTLEHLFIAIISERSEHDTWSEVHLAWLNIARKLLRMQVTIKPHM